MRSFNVKALNYNIGCIHKIKYHFTKDIWSNQGKKAMTFRRYYRPKNAYQQAAARNTYIKAIVNRAIKSAKVEYTGTPIEIIKLTSNARRVLERSGGGNAPDFTGKQWQKFDMPDGKILSVNYIIDANTLEVNLKMAKVGKRDPETRKMRYKRIKGTDKVTVLIDGNIIESAAKVDRGKKTVYQGSHWLLGEPYERIKKDNDIPGSIANTSRDIIDRMMEWVAGEMFEYVRLTHPKQDFLQDDKMRYFYITAIETNATREPLAREKPTTGPGWRGEVIALAGTIKSKQEVDLWPLFAEINYPKAVEEWGIDPKKWQWKQIEKDPYTWGI